MGGCVSKQNSTEEVTPLNKDMGKHKKKNKHGKKEEPYPQGGADIADERKPHPAAAHANPQGGLTGTQEAVQHGVQTSQPVPQDVRSREPLHPQTRPSYENQSPDKDIASLKQRLAQAERNYEDSQKDLDKLKDKYDKSQGKLGNVQRHDQEQTQKIDRLNQTIQTLNDQIQTLSGENEELKKSKNAAGEDKETKKEMNDLQQTITARNNEIQSLQAENTKLQKENEKLKKSKKSSPVDPVREEQWQRAVSERDQKIRDLNIEIQEASAKNESLLKNMSSLMNQTMARDESDLENINVKNRPMNVMDDFTTFCSQEWLDAKTVIDDWAETQDHDVDDAMAFNLLLDGIRKCYDTAQAMFEATKQHFHDVTENPLKHVAIGGPGVPLLWHSADTANAEKHATKPGKHRKSVRRELDVDFQVSIAKALKVASDNIDFKPCAQNLAVQFLRERKQTDMDEKLATHEDILAFFERCMQISWNMVIQRPAMKYQCLPDPGGNFEELKHELHFNSADPKCPGAVIHYYVHPAVLHGGKQMRKARVVLHIPEAWSEKSTASGVPTDTQDRHLYDTAQPHALPGKPAKRHSGGKYHEGGPEAKASRGVSPHESKRKGQSKMEIDKKRTSSASEIRDPGLAEPLGSSGTHHGSIHF